MDSLTNTIRRTLLRLGNGASWTDRELLGRYVAAHDQAAFAQLVRRHGPMVLGVCQRVLHHAQDAEDAFQATFVVLSRKAAMVSPPELLANWLYGVAQRVARKARAGVMKCRSRERSGSGTTLDFPAEQDRCRPPDWEHTLDEELSRLPDKYRAPLVLCYLQGKSNAEAARTLHCEISAVKMRLSRARDLLHGRLTRRGVTLAPALLTAALTQQATATAQLPTNLLQSAVRVGLASPGAASSHALAAAVLGDMSRRRLALLAAIALLGIGGAWLWNTAQSRDSSPGPQFSQATSLTVHGTGSNAGNFGQYYRKGGMGVPQFFGTNCPQSGGCIQFFNNSAPAPVTAYALTAEIVSSTATSQQVRLATKGTMAVTVGGSVSWIPVNLQISITLSSKPAHPVHGLDSKLATMSFTALDAAGRQVFDSGPMSGAWE
jgi:RNA polymerase sigma factor (sigma-70 family)